MVKKLTPENWLEPEPIMSLFMQMGPGGSSRSMSGEDWLKLIISPTLDEPVPREVKDLFETVRGALAYGYFFYPLYALGMGQLFRVAEAAVTHKCKAMGIPAGVKRFHDRIEWLISRGVIAEQEKGKWDAIRGLRNIESHPERQTLLTPGPVIEMFMRMAEDISDLFRTREHPQARSEEE